MCILELSKVQIYELHYYYVRKCNIKSRSYFADNGGLVYEIENENFYDNFSKINEIFHFGNYSTNWKYYDNLNALIVF